MCSTRCEIPASLLRSITEPDAIQNPSATERTPGTRSVTILTPESSDVIRCSVALTPMAWAARAPAHTSRTALAAPAAGRAAVGALAAIPGGAAIAVARPAASARAPTGPHAGELLDRLAGDVRVV